MVKTSTFLCVLFSLITLQAVAQNEAITEPQLFYRKRVQLGMNLNSSGLGGINFKYGWQKTGTKKNMLDIEFARLRHPKETRIYGQSETPNQYTLGRLNMLFSLRTGYGQTIFITERPYKNAIQLNFNYALGISTAILKPIYLDILYTNPDGYGNYVVPERYNQVKHANTSNIYGNSSFFQGISNTSLQFGAYGKASLSIEWGEFPDECHTVEAGVALDIFPDALPLMAYQPKTAYLVNLFIGYQFGWNK
ncbi:MAG: hypothetical protein V4651_11350 [Bacteroidota bacterium]